MLIIRVTHSRGMNEKLMLSWYGGSVVKFEVELVVSWIKIENVTMHDMISS